MRQESSRRTRRRTEKSAEPHRDSKLLSVTGELLHRPCDAADCEHLGSHCRVLTRVGAEHGRRARLARLERRRGGGHEGEGEVESERAQSGCRARAAAERRCEPRGEEQRYCAQPGRRAEGRRARSAARRYRRAWAQCGGTDLCPTATGERFRREQPNAPPHAARGGRDLARVGRRERESRELRLVSTEVRTRPPAPRRVRFAVSQFLTRGCASSKAAAASTCRATQS